MDQSIRQFEPCHAPFTADDIQWTSQPISNLEDRSVNDLLALEHEELAVYAFDLQGDLRNVRGLWHDTVSALARTVDQRDRAIFTLRKARRAA
jgi:hypothetical protein